MHSADEENKARLGEGLASPPAWAHRDDNSLTDKPEEGGSDLKKTRLPLEESLRATQLEL